MASISVVLTARSGFEGYTFLDEVFAEDRGRFLEVLIMDSTPGYVDRSRRGLRHISLPGVSHHALITAGMVEAKGEWIWLSEDHARPLPGIIDAFENALRANPGADLISGETENLTSTEPWSFANFLLGLADFWPPTKPRPDSASNANLFVRRSAILKSELATPGGFLYVTIPRLVAAGRYAHISDAIVDHTVHVTWRQCLAFQYVIAREGTAARRSCLPPRPLLVQFLRDILAFGYYSAYKPFLTMRQVRGTSQCSLAMALRVAVLGFPIAGGTMSADIARLRKAFS